MEAIRRHGRFDDGDGVIAQVGLDGRAQPLTLPMALKVEMRHLAFGVHAAIGAPGPEHGNLLGGDGKQGCLDGSLHRGPVRLALPADVGAPVIFDGQAIARHGHGLRPRYATVKRTR